MTRIVFVPQGSQAWVKFFQSQTGHGNFLGDEFQRGGNLGSVLRGLVRFILPIAKSAAKSVGKQALSSGVGIGSDLLAGENLGRSLKKRSRTAASNLMAKAAKRISGRGLGNRKRKRKVITVSLKGKGLRKKKTKGKRKKKVGLYY